MANILLANDMVALGSMTISALAPFMEARGHRVAKLPTGLVSNNFSFGSYVMRDCTDYVKESLLVWQKLGFSFDAAASGFLFSDEAAEVLLDYQRNNKVGLWVHDPIMGDEGDFYHGLGDELLARNIKMAEAADVMVPNYTEAYLLLGEKPPEVASHDEMNHLLKRLLKLGSASWVITSVPTEDKERGEIWIGTKEGIEVVSYPVVAEARVVGTGDLFTGYFVMSLLDQKKLTTEILAQGAKDAARALVLILKAVGPQKETDPMGMLLDKRLIDAMDTWNPTI